MSNRMGGLIPLLLRKSIVLPALRTLVEVGIFSLGLVCLHHSWLSAWELSLLALALGGVFALLIFRFWFASNGEAIAQFKKLLFFIPSALLFILGWSLWRWAHLPEILFKVGLIIFLFNTVLSLQYLERDWTPETAISFFQLSALIPFPLFLSILFNLLHLL